MAGARQAQSGVFLCGDMQDTVAYGRLLTSSSRPDTAQLAWAWRQRVLEEGSAPWFGLKQRSMGLEHVRAGGRSSSSVCFLPTPYSADYGAHFAAVPVT